MTLSLSTLAFLALLTAVPSAAGEEARRLSIEIGGPQQESLSINLSGALVGTLFDKLLGADLQCEGELDPEVEAMLTHLQRRGEGSRYTLREDGKKVRARRRHGQLELIVRERGEKKAEISLPWTLAECMLGNPGALARHGRGGHFELELEDRGYLRIRLR